MLDLPASGTARDQEGRFRGEVRSLREGSQGMKEAAAPVHCRSRAFAVSVALIAALAMAAGPAAARAAQVDPVLPLGDYAYTAGSGEQNDLTVSLASGWFTFHDDGALIALTP
ncbi:hypothetical protein LCGC14_2231950, partial [marine sediment metagenome]